MNNFARQKSHAACCQFRNSLRHRHAPWAGDFGIWYVIVMFWGCGTRSRPIPMINLTLRGCFNQRNRRSNLHITRLTRVAQRATMNSGEVQRPSHGRYLERPRHQESSRTTTSSVAQARRRTYGPHSGSTHAERSPSPTWQRIGAPDRRSLRAVVDSNQ